VYEIILYEALLGDLLPQGLVRVFQVRGSSGDPNFQFIASFPSAFSALTRHATMRLAINSQATNEMEKRNVAWRQDPRPERTVVTPS
jgi:hypothetical protein